MRRDPQKGRACAAPRRPPGARGSPPRRPCRSLGLQLLVPASSLARRSKRFRSGGAASEEASIDLLALYEGDLGKQIISYASPRFQKLTTEPWKKVTKARFGLKNGKEGWKLGTSFLREPTYACLTDDGDFGYGDSYGGTARVASNGSILVAVTDDPHDPYGNNERARPEPESLEEEEILRERERTYPGEQNGMGLRDAFTLNYIRTVPSPIQNCRVAICGHPDSELIVTSSSAKVVAHRGQDWSHVTGGGDGIPIIGNESHLIIGHSDCIEIQEFRTDREGPELDWAESCRLGAYTGAKITCLSWGPKEYCGVSEFAVGVDDEVLVVGFRYKKPGWKAQPNLSNMGLEAYVTESIDTAMWVQSVALTEDFIVVGHDKKINVWRRGTGELLHKDLCDVEEEDELWIDDIVHPLHFSCHGNILVTTSHKGCALCVWDIKKGELLKRYNHAEEEMNVNMLPDGADCTDMTYLEPLNGFVCMAGNMNVWAFPVNKRQAEMAQSIKRREEMLQKALYL